MRDLFWSAEGRSTCPVTGMCFEEFLVFFMCVIFFGVRSKESQEFLQGVRVPLWLRLGEEDVAKVILQNQIVGGAVICYVKGRAFPKKKTHFQREFDCTKGYKGQDI